MLTTVAVLVVIGTCLGVIAWRSGREAHRLRERLEYAAAELQHLQLSFGRFAPDAVIEKIIADGTEGIGERKEVTVLFADLVDFTAMSDSTPPTVLVRILNGYFDRMATAITNHGGYVSTFLGDGILAFFGAMRPNPWQGNDAVHAAIEMGRALEAYNDELAAEGLPRLSLGIGLERGTGVAGLVGSRALKEFTVVGGSVNVAARVQDLTRVYPADIILTRSLRDSLDPRFRLRELPDTPLKGIEKPVSIYAVDGFDESWSPALVEALPTNEPPHSVIRSLPLGFRDRAKPWQSTSPA